MDITDVQEQGITYYTLFISIGSSFNFEVEVEFFACSEVLAALAPPTEEQRRIKYEEREYQVY